MFLAKYGSHYVSGVDMGCSVTWTHTVPRQDISQIQATVQGMSRMERCTSTLDAKQSERADLDFDISEEQFESDAEMGQSINDALGPSKVDRGTIKKNKKHKKHTKRNEEDSDGITVEDVDEEEEEEENNRRRRRRLLHSKRKHKHHHKEEEEEDQDDGKNDDYLKCSQTRDKTLIDLGVVNPSLKFVGGDLTLAPKSIESIKDARLEPYLASCMDQPAPIGRKLDLAGKSLLMRPLFMETCSVEHTLYTYTKSMCTKIVEKMTLEEKKERNDCFGTSGVVNCIEQCSNTFMNYYQECKSVGITMTAQNKNKAISDLREYQQEQNDDNNPNVDIGVTEPFEYTNTLEICSTPDCALCLTKDGEPTEDQTEKPCENAGNKWIGLAAWGNSEKKERKAAKKKDKRRKKAYDDKLKFSFLSVEANPKIDNLKWKIVDGIQQCREWDQFKPWDIKDENKWKKDNDITGNDWKDDHMWTLAGKKFITTGKLKQKIEKEEEQKNMILQSLFWGIPGYNAKGENGDRNKIYDVLDEMAALVYQQKGNVPSIPSTKKELSKYVGGRKLLRRVSTLQNVGRLVDMLGVKLADLRGDSLMYLQNGETRLKHMQEALKKQTKLLEQVVGSSSRQESIIENVRNYFSTSTATNAVEALAELYPITMTALSDARLLFAQHCKTEREVKDLQVRLFTKIENQGLRNGFRSKNAKKKSTNSKEKPYGLFQFQGPTGTKSAFDGDTRLWELQCVRQHEAKVQRANQGYIDKIYLSDSGSKRARGLHIMEHRRTMVCPLCVSLVTNELDDERETKLSMRGLESGTMSSVFAFCQGQSDPYYKITCHHIATGLQDIISNQLELSTGGGSAVEDADTLLLRTHSASLRFILDRLLSPDGRFSSLGGGDASLWKEAEGMDGGGNQSPKLLIAADVCAKFMACDSYAPSGLSGGSGSAAEVGDAAGAASQDDASSGGSGSGGGGTTELMLDEGVKLLEKWDSQNDNTEQLEEVTSSIIKLAESSHDRMVCDDFARVQQEYSSLKRSGDQNGNTKLCFACVKMATLAVRDALNFDKENEQEETVNSIFQDTEESICEPKLWTETKDLLKEAMDQCKGGGGSSGSSSTSSFLELYQTTYNLNMKSIEKGPASHAANYIQKLNLPLVCPTFASYYDTNNKGSKRITSKDIATYIAQLSCAKEKTSDMPEKTYSSSVCSKYVTHLRTNMINRLQQLAILNAYPSDVGSLSGETFLKLLSTGKHDGDMEVYDFANDVCVRPGMGKYKSDAGAM